jgi:hypothetical protein
MYEVLDLAYTKEEEQSVFKGTYEECEEFIEQQCTMFYESMFYEIIQS